VNGSRPIRVPPGRAGILLLRRRLAVAEAGAALLTRKLFVLGVEAERLDARVRDTERSWHAAAATAQQLLDLAGRLGGDRAIRLAALPPETHLDVHCTTLMGLTYPEGVGCELPPRPPDAMAAAGATLLLAERAVREAVPAAARHAAGVQAADTVRREVDLTRQRLRALQHHLIPALRETLARQLRQVEEIEAADAVLRRWAVQRLPTGTDVRPRPKGLSPLS